MFQTSKITIKRGNGEETQADAIVQSKHIFINDIKVAIGIDDIVVYKNPAGHDQYFKVTKANYLVAGTHLDHIEVEYQEISNPDATQAPKPKEEASDPFIEKSLLDQLEKLTGPYNYKKLIALVKELDADYEEKHPHACAALIRTILDHIPPVFGYASFEEASRSYGWSRSDKAFAGQLVNFKAISHDSLHRHISQHDLSLSIQDISSIRMPLRRILQAFVDASSSIKTINTLPTKIRPPSPNIEITANGKPVVWARYGEGTGFVAVIKINNYKSDKPDFVRDVSIKGTLGDGSNLELDQFKFTRGSGKNQAFKVDANDIQDNVAVYVSNSFDPLPPHENPMPDFDRDTVRLNMKTESGKTFSLPIKIST